jgi:anaerobic magnesium-protoporphyrin IX monomethyl ester cyclase
MKVLFIYPVPPSNLQILRYQQGIGSLAAVLKQAGHSAELLVLQRFDPDRINATLARTQPHLVALSLTSNFFEIGRQVARHVATQHHLPVILGGIHPTLCPEETIEAEGVFALCRGEGEFPLLELCEALQADRDPTGIPNLWVKSAGKIHRNEIRPLINPLDQLPYPDREIFDFTNLLKQFPEAEFMGSRGCPFQCTYCANHALVELYRGKGPYVRFRSIPHLMGEIESVFHRYPEVGFLGFHDDTFTLNPRWTHEFLDAYSARFKTPFWCNATADSITPDLAARLKQAGCYEVRMGVESGSDTIRTEILRKKVPREAIVSAFKILREAGITRYAFNMVGLPFETPQTIRETVALNQEIQPDQVFCSVFYPYPGTQSWELCRSKGWISGTTVSSYFAHESALDQPTIRRREVVFTHEIFRDLVRWPRWDWLIRALHHIPVTRTKSAWNLFRRLRAKTRETLDRVADQPHHPE